MKHVIVQINEIEYRIWQVRGHQPVNYICDAPLDPTQVQALEDEQAAGGQTLISAWVDSQINP